MNVQQRWLYAIALVLVDIVAVFVPLAAILGAYVLVTRPPWFRDLVDDLYRQ